jgi:hypothetical protein
MWRVALILVLAVRTVSAEEPVRPTCDAAALEKEGDDAWAKGWETQALDKYEKALRCEVVEKRVLKAGFASCKLYQHNRSEAYSKRAKRYYDMLKSQANKDTLAKACTPTCRLE